MKHVNSGRCEKCQSILDRYPGFYAPLRAWFEDFQSQHREGHISCAGRGQADQEDLFVRGASKAHWTKSAHNWNAAFDLFEFEGDLRNIYEPHWFLHVLRPALNSDLVWYGDPYSKFRELPHVEWKGWRELAHHGVLKLVEATALKVV